MPLRKSHLYSSLWKSCDELRGGMDASQYKDYVLTLLFMKYVSDKYAGDDEFADITVPAGGSFADMVALKGTKEIGDRINKVIGRLADANDHLLKGVIDLPDFNDETKLGKGREMQDRLTKLVGIFEGLDFRANRAHGDDLLGDAYEYLMRHFATQSGKSKGQFYTPAEVSRIMAQVIGIGADARLDQTVYDPTCGSGSLLIKAADAAPNGLTIHGQEKDAAHEEYRRFDHGEPPAKNGDYAYLLHLVASLRSTGKGAIVMPHGVLFRGNREAAIRRNLVKRGWIKGVIGLPANLFYGTGIPACIVVIDKEDAVARRGIFMIDASKGFRKDGAKNRLRERDIHRIVDVFTEQREVPGCSRMVPLTEIASEANDYNLNIPRYIDSSEPEDLHDLAAHLHGGIPNRDIDALGDYWEVFPGLRKHAPRLRELAVADSPKDLIRDLSEDLLHRFAGLPLLDRYGVYQCLMDYWDEVMQDDVYLVVTEGWTEAARPRVLVRVKGKGTAEKPDLTVARKKYRMDLVPPGLVVARYFATEQAEVDRLRTKQESIARELEEFIEEYSGEDGLLEGATSDAGKVTQAAVRARLKAVAGDPEGQEERDVLEVCLDLMKALGAARRAAKAAQTRLDSEVLARYAKLTAAEITELVVGDKWMASVEGAIGQVVERLTGGLVDRVRVLEGRYAKPLPQLERRVEDYGAKVGRGIVQRCWTNSLTPILPADGSPSTN